MSTDPFYADCTLLRSEERRVGWELIKTENEHIIILLKLLSSCLGINVKNGEPVDALFLRKYLADSINKLFRITNLT